MVLSGTSKAVQEYYRKLGIEIGPVVEEIIPMCHGIPSLREGKRLYYFLYHSLKTPLKGIKKLSEQEGVEFIRDCLQKSSRLQDEDIEQQIYIFIQRKIHAWQMADGVNDKGLYEFLKRTVIDYIARYIMNEKVFHEFLDWSHKKQDFLEEMLLKDNLTCEYENRVSIKLISGKGLLETLPIPLYERYTAYLSYVLGMTDEDVAKILLMIPRRIRTFNATVKKRMKELNSANEPKPKRFGKVIHLSTYRDRNRDNREDKNGSSI